MLFRFLFIWLFLIGFVAHAQPSRRAVRLYHAALKASLKKNDKKAIEKLNYLIEHYPQYDEPYSTLGNWYFNHQQFQEALIVFKKANVYAAKSIGQFDFPLAKSIVYAGKADEALGLLSSRKGQEWQRLYEQARFILQNRNSKIKDTAVLVSRVNSRFNDLFPFLSNDGTKLYFTRKVNDEDQDFFVALKDSCGGWFKPYNLGSPPNTPDQEMAQRLSADGHYLFYTKCENRSESGWEMGGCDLYMCYRSDSVWSAPENFGGTVNSPAYEGMACLSPDNRALYFVSNRPGGFGGMDIWVTYFEKGLWQQPKNLGPKINTDKDETAPYLHADNATLYFSSNGHLGFGNADLFLSKKINDSTWSAPINLGSDINSSSDEIGACTNFKGDTLVFSSNRLNGNGQFDLYEISLDKTLRPKAVVALGGFVQDSISDLKLNYASIFIKEKYTGNPSYQLVSNRGDGSYMITLPVGKTYVWSTDRISYLKREDEIELSSELVGTTQLLNIALLPDDYIAPVNDSLIATIYFAKNTAILSDQDKNRIQKAMAPWLLEPNGVTVLCYGYTDNSGTPLLNEQLSFLRAGLVSKEITSLGWHSENIETKGWGEAKPLAPNDTEMNRNLNRRVEIIIRR